MRRTTKCERRCSLIYTDDAPGPGGARKRRSPRTFASHCVILLFKTCAYRFHSIAFGDSRSENSRNYFVVVVGRGWLASPPHRSTPAREVSSTAKVDKITRDRRYVTANRKRLERAQFVLVSTVTERLLGGLEPRRTLVVVVVVAWPRLQYSADGY